MSNILIKLHPITLRNRIITSNTSIKRREIEFINSTSIIKIKRRINEIKLI